MGLTAAEEEQMCAACGFGLVRPVAPSEEESALIEIMPDKDDQILPGGPITLKHHDTEHLIVIADALSKSVVLARDEREVASVFDLVEPFARQLADHGRRGRRAQRRSQDHRQCADRAAPRLRPRGR